MFLRILGVLATLSFFTFAHAEPAKPDAGAPAPSAASAPVSAVPSIAPGVDGGVPSAAVAPSVAPSVPAPVSLALASAPGEDFTVQDAVSAYKVAKQAVQGPSLLGICAAISVFSLLLVKGLRRYGKMLLSQAHVNVAVTIASALAAGAASVVPGMPWWQALFVGISPLVLTLSPGAHPPQA